MLRFHACRVIRGPASGFDMGDMTFTLDDNELSSKQHPRFRMMIYLSIVSLLDGLLSINDRQHFEFVAVDSSFTLTFTLRTGRVFIKSEVEECGPFNLKSLFVAVLKGVENFMTQDNQLPENDPVYADLDKALADIRVVTTREF